MYYGTRGLTILSMLILAACSDAPRQDAALAAQEPSITTQEISYDSDGATMRGLLAFDASKQGRRPGILVVHEWWGHNDYARRRAKMLAELGYTAFALDMFGDGKTANHPDEAMAFVQELFANMDVARARFEAAREVLASHETVDPGRIGAIGYCFGGGVVLEMARLGTSLKGVVTFHGLLATAAPAAAGAIQPRILILQGGSDPLIPPEQLEAFRQEMDQAGADYEVVVFDDAMHSFTNPMADSLGERFGMPLRYNADADRESWEKMKAFFRDVFGA